MLAELYFIIYYNVHIQTNVRAISASCPELSAFLFQ